MLLVSEQVHDGVVRHAYDGIDPAGYQPVWVTGEGDQRPRLGPPAGAADPAGAGPAPEGGGRAQPRSAGPGHPTGAALAMSRCLSGRRPEVDWLLEAVEEIVNPGSAVVLAIDGMGGPESPPWPSTSLTGSPTPSRTGSCGSTFAAPRRAWRRWSRARR